MAYLKIIHEGEVLSDVALLAQHWIIPATFLFIPDKSGISESWLGNAAKLFPLNYQKDCFGIFTSGSTGEPKLMVGSKQRSVQLVRVLHELQVSESVDETLCVLPLSYSYAFVNQWVWSITLGRRLRLTSGFNRPEALQKALLQARTSMLCMVSGQISLIRSYYPDSVFPGITRLHFAGGRFPQEQLDFLRHVFPNAQIYNNYGCAEAMPRLTIRRAEAADSADNIGHTLPGVEMRSDEENRLLFRSPYRAVAYVDEHGFHEVTDDEWLPTGDLGEQLEDGSWRLLGRASDVFKRFGEKVSLSQALTTIKSCWDGDAAFYLEVDPGGEQGAVLVLSPEPDNDQLRNILKAFRHNYRRPHWPLRIESLDTMPLLPNGKTNVQMLDNAQNKKLHWKQRI